MFCSTRGLSTFSAVGPAVFSGTALAAGSGDSLGGTILLGALDEVGWTARVAGAESSPPASTNAPASPSAIQSATTHVFKVNICEIKGTRYLTAGRVFGLVPSLQVPSSWKRSLSRYLRLRLRLVR